MKTTMKELVDAMADFRSECDDRILPDGAELGKWRVLAFIDEGGYGEVYRVQNMADGGTSSFAVLKILKLKEDKEENENARRRFENELKYLQELKSASFPAYMDKGAIDDHPYFIMEELRRLDLPNDDEHVAEFMMKVCKGIRELHLRNIIHRDIKPKNIMFRADGTPVIVDLGLCKTGGKTEDGHVEFAGSSISMVGGQPTGVGTPEYSAPEQFLYGKSYFSSDIYSLGKVAIECFKRKVPEVWKPVLNRATSTPDQRYQSVKDFEDAIARRHRTAKPRGLLEKVALLGCVVAMAVSALVFWKGFMDASGGNGFGNIPVRVIDGGVFWDVISSTNGWKLEKHKLFENCRILDTNRVRVAWGGEETMRQRFKEILSGKRICPEHLDSTAGWRLVVSISTLGISLLVFLLLLQREWLKRGIACVAKIMNRLVKLFNHSGNSD